MNLSGDAPAGGSEYPVFTKRGDARAEVDAIARAQGVDPATAGVHKCIYVARANQTVVMLSDRSAPLASQLRARGWDEPRDPSRDQRS